MGYVTPEQIAQAREMDLLTYLQTFEPQELVKFSGNTYCTREHDSLKISNGKWCWHSRGFGGTTALDYLVKVKEMPFVQAVETITGCIAVQPQTRRKPAEKQEEKPKVLLLPKVSRCATNAVNYLHSRGIDYDLIHYCITTGRLFESYPHHSVVFVGMDRDGKARYGNIRGIGNDFVGDANGSDKRFSFSIPAENSHTLCLFESAIDLLSFATLLKIHGRRWNADHLVSLAGVYKPRENIRESTVPLALQQYLTDYPEIREVHLCLDNDYGGRMAGLALKTLLPEKYGVTVIERYPPRGKDYNDYLCDHLGLPRTKARRKEHER